jgi:hypothetical protein
MIPCTGLYHDIPTLGSTLRLADRLTLLSAFTAHTHVDAQRVGVVAV